MSPASSRCETITAEKFGILTGSLPCWGVVAVRGRIFATVAALVATMTIAFGLAPNAGSTTVLLAGGTGGSLGKLFPDNLFGTKNSFLGGAYKNDLFTVLDYPNSLWPITGPFDPTLGKSVAIGVANLVDLAKSTPGPLVISGTSQGAMVAQQAEAILNADPGIPSDTTFIIIADPNLGLGRSLYGMHLPILNYTPQPLAETRFNTVVVINQYDGWADPITNPWNLLTVANALMGLIYVHPYAQNSDLSTVPTEDVNTRMNSQGGTVTTYFVPTEHLPLTMLLRQLYVPAAIVDGIDNLLRPIIDAGYAQKARHLPWAPTAPVSTMPVSHRMALQRNDVATRAAVSKACRGALLVPKRHVSGRGVKAEARHGRTATAYARPRGSSWPPAATETSGQH